MLLRQTMDEDATHSDHDNRRQQQSTRFSHDGLLSPSSAAAANQFKRVRIYVPTSIMTQF